MRAAIMGEENSEKNRERKDFIVQTIRNFSFIK